VIPHLLPLTTFMALIKIMDNLRLFEPIVSFSASGHAQPPSYFLYSDLGGEARRLSSAAAISVLTIPGVVVPVVARSRPHLAQLWKGRSIAATCQPIGRGRCSCITPGSAAPPSGGRPTAPAAPAPIPAR